MSKAHDTARKCIKTSLMRQKLNYDEHVAGDNISEGMFVWLHNTARKKGLSPKLQYK